MASDSSASNNNPLLVLGKISAILDAFSLARPTLTLGEIRQATGIPTSTVQRLVTNLVTQRFLDREDDRFRIGLRMAYWAAPALKGIDMLDIVAPVLKELRDAAGETACFFREEQGYRVCVAIAETRHEIRREMHVGKILPLHAGSAGRVLLAWDPELLDRVLTAPLQSITEGTLTSASDLADAVARTRIDGYAITTGEREDGASGLSAPVFNSAAEVVAALTISGPTLRMPFRQCEEWVDLLVGTADQITRMLGGRHPSPASVTA